MKKLLVLVSLVCTTILQAQIVNYPWPSTAQVSDKYSVKAWKDGQEVQLFTHYSEPNLKVGPDGTGVTGNIKGRSLSYVPFAFSGEIDVEVTKLYGSASPRVDIQPKAFGLQPYYFDGKKVRFKLKHQPNKPTYISVLFFGADNEQSNGSAGKDIKNGLVLFGDLPEIRMPDPNGPGVVKYSATADLSNASVIYFEPGDYNLKDKFADGVLRLTRNGQQVYAAGGAFIRGAVHGTSKDDVSVFGRGIFTGADMVWHEIRTAAGIKDAFMNFMGSDRCQFEGVTVVNPTHHTWPSSSNNIYRNIKIIGWASNHDGVRPAGGSLIDQVFIKTHDDYDYARDPHVFRNSVVWPMQNGSVGQLGWNNLGVGKTTIENLYVINPEWRDINKRNIAVLGSVLQQGADLANDTLRNVYAEDNMIALIHLTMLYDRADPLIASDPGELKNFYFKNIIVEKPFIGPDGKLYKNKIGGYESGGIKGTVHDITFVNLIAGNQVVTQANAAQYFDIDPATTYNIVFKQEGEIYSLQTSATAGGQLSPSGTVPTPAGMDRAINILPNAGYRIKNVVVDGQSKGRLQSYVFEDIQASHTLFVEFEAAANDYYSQPPVAAQTVTPIKGKTPLFVTFDASASKDPDGEALRYAWNFGDGSVSDTSTIAMKTHTYTTAGKYQSVLTVWDAMGNADADTVAIEVTDSLVVWYRLLKNLPYDNQIMPYLQLNNTSANAIPYNDLTVKYWFTAEPPASLTTYVDYTPTGKNTMLATTQMVSPVREGANRYLNLAFTPNAGILAAYQKSGQMQVRVVATNGVAFDETNDYSYLNTSLWNVHPQITLYQKGMLAWGVEPTLGIATATRLADTQMCTTCKTVGVYVYPNPFSQELTLTFDTKLQPTEIILTDLSGRMLLKQQVTSKQMKLDLPTGLTHGMYMLQVLAPSGKQTIPVMKW